MSVDESGSTCRFAFPPERDGNLGAGRSRLRISGRRPASASSSTRDRSPAAASCRSTCRTAATPGILQLEASARSVTAIGLLDTRLPDGSSGLLVPHPRLGRVPADPARLRLHAQRRRRAGRHPPHGGHRGAAPGHSRRRAQPHHVPARSDPERAADHQRPARDLPAGAEPLRLRSVPASSAGARRASSPASSASSSSCRIRSAS